MAPKGNYLGLGVKTTPLCLNRINIPIEFLLCTLQSYLLREPPPNGCFENLTVTIICRFSKTNVFVKICFCTRIDRWTDRQNYNIDAVFLQFI